MGSDFFSFIYLPLPILYYLSTHPRFPHLPQYPHQRQAVPHTSVPGRGEAVPQYPDAGKRFDDLDLSSRNPANRRAVEEAVRIFCLPFLARTTRSMYGRHRLHRAGADGQRRCCSGRRGGRRRQRGAHGPVPAVEPVQFVVRQKSYSPDGDPNSLESFKEEQ